MDEEKGEKKHDKQPESRKSWRRFWWVGGLAMQFLGAGLAYGCYWYFWARFYVSTDDAYIHGNQIPVTPQVSGIVSPVEVDDTDLVEQGQVLVRLDQNDAKVALEQAESQLGQAVRQVRQLYQQEAQ
jgi:membrane fusion protein, multidrug efflux system